MKRIHLFEKGTLEIPLCAILALSACTNNDEIVDDTKFQDSKLTQVISIAKEAYVDFYGNAVRATNFLDVSPRNTYTYCTKSSRSEAPDTLFYVVNFGEQEGFAIVSNRSGIDPLIGISDSGHYNPHEVHVNTNFQHYMDGVIETLSSSSDDHSGLIIRRDLVENCPPKVLVEWGQGEPYNAYCDNGLTGCSNTAMAMIMSYFEQPADIAMTAGYWDVHIMQLDWEAMKLHRRQPDRCYEDDAEGTHEMLSKLLRQIGCDANSTYLTYSDGGAGTATNPYTALNVIGRYGFSHTPPVNFSNVDYKYYLRNNYILFAFGFLENSNKGHGWVFDGFKRYRYNGMNYFEDFCHYNWGWDGQENGYFRAGIFDVTQADSYDNGHYERTYDFSDDTKLSAISYHY